MERYAKRRLIGALTALAAAVGISAWANADFAVSFKDIAQGAAEAAMEPVPHSIAGDIPAPEPEPPAPAPPGGKTEGGVASSKKPFKTAALKCWTARDQDSGRRLSCCANTDFPDASPTCRYID